MKSIHIVTWACALALFDSRASAQLIPPPVIFSATATSGTVDTSNLTLNGFVTGFNFAGNLYWNDVQTQGAILTMIVRCALDPTYNNNNPILMQTGASMSGTFDVPNSGPFYRLNSFTLTTDIPGLAGSSTTSSVIGPYSPGTYNYSAATVSPPFSYTAGIYPYIDLTLVVNADGGTPTSQFRIDFPAGATFQPAPEPASIACFAAAGLLCLRRRRAVAT